MITSKRDALIEAMNANHPTPVQRELIGAYVEGMTGVHNAYCLTSEDLQTLARYVLDKSNHNR